MKHLMLLVLLFLVCILPIKAQTVHVDTDERAELVSIVGRLAQFQEYSSGEIQDYNDAIDTCFSSFTNHPIIALSQEYRRDFGLSYDAMMWVALHVDLIDKGVQVNKFAYNNLPSRWTKERFEKYVTELSDFYKQTDFAEFYSSHTSMYEEAVKEVKDALTSHVSLAWFNDFWGTQSAGNFHVIVSLVNGCGNYGLKTVDDNQHEEVYSVIGVCPIEQINPSMTVVDYLVPLFVHETNHSYEKGVSEIVEKTRKAGEIIFPTIAEQMKGQAYGSWAIVVEEAMVRAGVINYMKNDSINKFDSNREITIQKGRSFFWIDRLVKLFDTYQQNREKYPTMKELVPEVVQMYDELAAQMSAPGFAFPNIADATVKDGEVIPVDTKELTFTFNKPMLTRGYGFNYGKLGKESMPKIDKIVWVDETHLKLTIRLEKNKSYSLRLFTQAYSDTEGFPMQQGFELTFTTAP